MTRSIPPLYVEKFHRDELVRAFKREFALHFADPLNPDFAFKLAVSDTHLTLAVWRGEKKTITGVPVAWFFEAGEKFVHELVVRTVRKILEELRRMS